MTTDADYDNLDDQLRAAGSGWDAAGVHGLLTGRLAVQGAAAGSAWLALALEDATPGTAARRRCERTLAELFQESYRQLTERQSEFAPLLPDDSAGATVRARCLARWSEAFLHGLVSIEHDETVKKRLAAEPVAGIIRDLLEFTRATADASDEADERAYAELVEYLRVATQLVYEELAELRPQTKQ